MGVIEELLKYPLVCDAAGNVLSYSLTLVSVRAGTCVRTCVYVRVSGHLTFEDLAILAHHLLSWCHFSFLPSYQDVCMGVASIQSWEPTGTTVTVGECLGPGGTCLVGFVADRLCSNHLLAGQVPSLL